MNVENILAVADAIEAGSIPDLGFDMHDYISLRHCGTTACIAGWAAIVAGGGNVPLDGFMPDPHGDAQTYFGLDPHDSSSLFLPLEGAFVATPAQAVRCLRHLAATGEVDWPRAMGAPDENA
jgi:hypothetical protein